MNLENQENYDNLIQWLMNYCFNHKIGVVFNKDLPPRARPRSYTEPGNLVVINGAWLPQTEIPFIFGHEIGHVIEDSAHLYHATKLGELKGEAFANRFSVELLYKYCVENDFYYSNWYSFAKAFCIPTNLFYLFSTIEYAPRPCSVEY